MKEHYWSLCNKYLAKTTKTQMYMSVQGNLKHMSDLFFCCFQKIFFVFCRIFIGLPCQVVHLTKKINGKNMKDYTRLTPFAHKDTLRKCLHFSLIRVSIEILTGTSVSRVPMDKTFTVKVKLKQTETKI